MKCVGLLNGRHPICRWVTEEVPVAANGEPGSGRSNIVLINIVLAVVDVVLLAVVVLLFVLPGGAGAALFSATEEEPAMPVEPAEEPEAVPDVPDEPAQESEPEPEPEPEPAEPQVVPSEREVTGRHTVQSGDTFYDISGSYWGNEHLWPDLYVLNQDGYPDPDLMRPGEVVEIYPSLDSDGELSTRDISVLSDAYVETYRAYRKVGIEALERGRASGSRYWIERSRNKINKAHWLLYSGHRFNRELLGTYAERIDDRDERVVRRYLERFGYPLDP
jgi:hypothetical protein